MIVGVVYSITDSHKFSYIVVRNSVSASRNMKAQNSTSAQSYNPAIPNTTTPQDYNSQHTPVTSCACPDYWSHTGVRNYTHSIYSQFSFHSALSIVRLSYCHSSTSLSLILSIRVWPLPWFVLLDIVFALVDCCSVYDRCLFWIYEIVFDCLMLFELIPDLAKLLTKFQPADFCTAALNYYWSICTCTPFRCCVIIIV